MGLSQSLYSGISGLKTHQSAMDNVGNNLANVNTVGFKKGVYQFRTLLEQTLRGGSMADSSTGRGSVNPLQIGLGTQTGSIMKDFGTGSVESTGNQKDMMIDGNGFFVLRSGNSNIYTRDGSFYLGSDGSLLYGDGLQVQGVQADAAGVISPTGSYSDIRIPIGETGAAIETTKASFTGNLNSNVETAGGIRLAANANAINMNEALSKYLGEVRDANNVSGVDDTTWTALTGDAYINGGTVWTSSSFGVKNVETGAIEPAVLTGDGATRLEDLWYLSGTTWTQPFKNIDNPPVFTVTGASQNALINWKYNATGFRMQENFYYNVSTDGGGNFLVENFSTDYNTLTNTIAAAGDANAVNAAYLEAYNDLLSSTASVVSPAHNSLAQVAYNRLTAPIADGGFALSDAQVAANYPVLYASLPTAADYTPQGSDIVAFKTTDAGVSWALEHDSTVTAAQARTAFDGSVKFGNTMVAGTGELHGYTPSNVDQTITVSYMKGGRSYSADFEYSDKNGAQSYTIEHLMKFLCGTVDSTISAASTQSIQTAQELSGGAMGTIQVAGKISSSIDGGEYGYNVPVETAGAFTRQGITNNVAYSGQFKSAGTDASQLTDLEMVNSGFSLKSKWYYAVEAFVDPVSSTTQYAVTAYSDSARTNAVTTSNKMLGSGSLEMRRSIDLDPAALPDDTYSYTTSGPDVANNYTLNIIDSLGNVVATGSGAQGAPVNLTLVLGGAPAGTVTFGNGTDLMTGGDTGTIYMKNMGTGLPPANSNLVLTTTVAGQTYAQNNGIGSYSSITAFDGGLHLGQYPSATVTSTSYGTFDTSGSSLNYSIVSNLGTDNAITDITFAYNNVSYNDVWTQDTKYSAEQGGSSTTNILVYDSLGNPKEVTITLSLVDRDSDFSTYRWIAESQDDTDSYWQIDPASKEITTNANVGTGTIRFDANGQFVKGVEYSETQGIELTLKNQGVSDVLRINLTEGLSKNADPYQDLDFSYLTQVASESDFNLKEQDGSAPGTLESFTTSLDGVIQGVYSNGVVKSIARLALAIVPNETGLMSAGGNLYYTSPASGDAQISFAGVGGRGDIRAASLETSNVDLSEEFTKLITTQRGFQANSRIISTSDNMLEELVNLVR